MVFCRRINELEIETRRVGHDRGDAGGRRTGAMVGGGREGEGRFSTDDRKKNYEKEARGMETD